MLRYCLHDRPSVHRRGLSAPPPRSASDCEHALHHRGTVHRQPHRRRLQLSPAWWMEVSQPDMSFTHPALKAWGIKHCSHSEICTHMSHNLIIFDRWGENCWPSHYSSGFYWNQNRHGFRVTSLKSCKDSLTSQMLTKCLHMDKVSKKDTIHTSSGHLVVSLLVLRPFEFDTLRCDG